MDSYNLINGEHATQNKYLNTDVLKKDWGFRGVLMSDWGATYDGIAAANSGLDLEMPSGDFMNAKTLLPAIQQGKVSAATIDDKVRRLLRIAVEFGFLNHDQQDLSIPLYNPQSEQVALESSLENMVLLKNQGALLPLDLQPRAYACRYRAECLSRSAHRRGQRQRYRHRAGEFPRGNKRCCGRPRQGALEPGP